MNKRSRFGLRVEVPGPTHRILLSLLVLLVSQAVLTPGPAIGQAQVIPHRRTCGTMEVHNRLLETVPDYGQRLEQIEAFTRDYLARLQREGGAARRSGVVTIPVVVHVVYANEAQNISDAQIQSQIDILNEDYRRLNADWTSAPAVFQTVAADVRIQFQLAVRDPDCGATNGITRTSTTTTSFVKDDAVKFASSGGHDAWPTDKYLNIWVCNLAGDLMGYGAFPGTPAAVDGVVIDYQYFGNVGTATSPFDLGRTTTHEVGHWLNLQHIWGGAMLSCEDSDEVDDTPNQDFKNFGCPTFPSVSCSNGPDGDMFCNYMDYVDDDCMVLFTEGQADRMDAALLGPRAAILGSDGLIPPPSVAGADLWSQDQTDDLGDEPNTVTDKMYRTDDIWVRRSNDGFTQQEHQNPQYRSSGDPNYVYVRVRNRGCSEASSADAKLYWAKASTALGWPAPWDGSVAVPAQMGNPLGTHATGAVSGGGFTILEFPWSPPNPDDYASFGADRGHFCLLSRIETEPTSPFGMTFPEGSGLNTNVRNNNNIVWKNVTVAAETDEGGRMASVSVGNLTARATQNKLVFEALPEGGRETLFDRGTVRVDLGDRLFRSWQQGGSRGKDVESLGRGKVRVRRSGAELTGLRLEPGELATVRVEFEPNQPDRVGARIFKLALEQQTQSDGEWGLAGGQTFVLKWAPHMEAQQPEQPSEETPRDHFSVDLAAGWVGIGGFEETEAVFEVTPAYTIVDLCDRPNPPLWCHIRVALPLIRIPGPFPDPWKKFFSEPPVPFPDPELLEVGPSWIIAANLEVSRRGWTLGENHLWRPSLFLGGGFQHDEGQTTEVSDFGAFRTTSVTSPLVTYGAALTYAFNERRSLRLEARGLTAFMDTMDVFGPNGASFTAEGGTMTSLQLTVGATIGF